MVLSMLKEAGSVSGSQSGFGLLHKNINSLLESQRLVIKYFVPANA